MKYKVGLFFLILFSLFFYFFSSNKVFASPESNCSKSAKEILDNGWGDECAIYWVQQANALMPAQENNKRDLANLRSQLADIKKKIDSLENLLKKAEMDINKREEDLAYAQEIFNEKALNQYKSLRLYDPILPFLFSSDASKAFKEISFRQKAADEDRKTMEEYANDLAKLKTDKENLEKNKTNLAGLQKQVAEKEKFLAGEVAKTENYLSSLSAKQSELIALKSGSFSVSVGNAALADDYNASFAGWQANAPGSSVTVFSFGAYAGNGSNYRRNGMSQYGAWNRAKSGQDYATIIQAYYGTAPIKIDSPATISTTVGVIPFEKQYLYGIAEMPSSWTDNNSAALKAQAIAARTFALRSNKPICITDKCQVYSASKVNDPSAQAWRDAVNATEGMVLPEGISAQYVSTPGGYLDTKGWDTVCGNQGCLVSNAWDGSSPWFYKAWYTNYKYPSGFSSCKRSNPWLSQTDFSDILNTWIVYNNGSNEDRSRIFPPDGCGGGSPFSVDEMRSKAESLGGAYSSVSSVNVQQSTSGYTSSVNFQTNKGQLNITGFDTGCSHKEGGCKDFWTIFNMRAPGNISIKNRMFDVRIK